MYKHLELEYQAFVGLYIIDISVQNNTNLHWSATIILIISKSDPGGIKKSLFHKNTPEMDVS